MLRILNRNINSTHRPMLPEQIEAVSPVWGKDIQKFGPWEFTEDESYLIAGEQLKSNITVTGECSSTFALADLLIDESSLGEWDSLIAVSQRKGRGRRKRRWISPPGNLYVSLVLPEIPTEWQTLGPLLTGFCLSSALNEMNCCTSVKWPNDILQNGKKVSGILIEQKKGHTVVGVGMNLVIQPENEQLYKAGAFPAGRLFESVGNAIGPISMWDFLVKRFKKLYYAFVDSGNVEKFINTVQPRLAFINKEVLISESGKEFPSRAVFTGIDSSGFARFLINGREQILREAKFLPD